MINPFTQKRWLIQVINTSEVLISLACDSLKCDYDTMVRMVWMPLGNIKNTVQI